MLSSSSDASRFLPTLSLLLFTTPIARVLASNTGRRVCRQPVCLSRVLSSPLAPGPCLTCSLFGHVLEPPLLFLILGPHLICHQTRVGAGFTIHRAEVQVSLPHDRDGNEGSTRMHPHSCGEAVPIKITPYYASHPHTPPPNCCPLMFSKRALLLDLTGRGETLKPNAHLHRAYTQ